MKPVGDITSRFQWRPMAIFSAITLEIMRENITQRIEDWTDEDALWGMYKELLCVETKWVLRT